MRLNKYLSEAGICSRREADRLIASGKVTVDGKIAVTGMQADETNDVKIGKKKIRIKDDKVVLAFYKPSGIECTEEKRVKNNVIRFLNYPVRVTYAGRLDKDSEGLLIMTNDGDLINSMMRARYYHEKEYRVKVDKPLTEGFVRQMSEGIHLVDKEKKLDCITRPCKVEQVGTYTFCIILTQGINRQIRRMCQALGYEVTRLTRTRIMNIELRSLKVGSYRKLDEQELKELYEQFKKNENAGAGGTAK